MKKTALLFIIALFAFAGCDRNPAGALIYPSDKYNSAQTWASTWVLFDDELKTRVTPFSAAVQAYTDYWNTRHAELNANCAGQAHTGRKSILMQWDGSPSSPLPPNADGTSKPLQKGYVGFGLPAAPPPASNPAAPNPSIDISPGNYNRVTFWAKGTLFQGVVFRVEVDGTDYTVAGTLDGSSGVYEGPVTDQWTQYSVTLKKTDISSFIKFILKNTMDPVQSNGGTVYIDDIELVQ